MTTTEPPILAEVTRAYTAGRLACRADDVRPCPYQDAELIAAWCRGWYAEDQITSVPSPIRWGVREAEGRAR